MSTQTIAPAQKVQLFKIGNAMSLAGLPDQFIAEAVETALRFEGVHDLMVMWLDEAIEADRAEIVADIQELIDDCRQGGLDEGVYVRFNDLDAIAKDIRGFKDRLRLIVEDRGGINHLAELTRIPQPSLSRFFGSAAMPRRATLLKIAKALDLGEVQIATKWSR